MQRLILSLVICLSFSAVQGQASFKRTTWNDGKKAVTVNVSEQQDDFYPALLHLEAPKPSGEPKVMSYLEKQKSRIGEKSKVRAKTKRNTKVGPPWVFSGFDANDFMGIPNDNNVAISNEGIIVSVINSNMRVYNQEGEQLLARGLAKLSEDLDITGNRFDPKVIYDPSEDKFILIFLNGNRIVNSRIVVAFSQTSDPTGDWNLYEIPGNPLDDESWSDYPIVSTTEDDLYITMNLLRQGGSWQESFKQSVIWQVNKASGYAGEELKKNLYSDIKYNGGFIRNLCPVKGGSKNYGPNCYFLSNRNFDLENDSIFFIEVTDNTENAEVKIQVLKSDVKYGMAPAASQPADDGLQTNDSRVLDAFIENGEIQFVSNSINPENNWAAAFHGVIEDASNPSGVKGHIITHPDFEYGYPAIAYAGNGSGDESLIIVNHSSADSFPGYSVLGYKEGEFSDPQIVVRGETHISVINGDERWGDYSGMQRKYNEPGKVWMSGTFGKRYFGGIGTVPNCYGTWVSAAQLNDLASSVPQVQKASNTSAYPNPFKDMISLDFDLATTSQLRFELVSMDGKRTFLAEQRAKAGTNRFVFSTQALERGTYVLQVISGNEIISYKKLTKN